MKRRNKGEKPNLTTEVIGIAIPCLVAMAAVRDWLFNWGTTPDEEFDFLPGDELAERITSTRAVTINAPVEEVWKWLVQIGQDRAGFYSYDVLERLVLADIHNVDRIVPEWQELEAGDTVRLASKRVYGDVPLLRVLAIEPCRYLVLERWGAFILRRIDDHTTRMIFRSHAEERSLLRRFADFLFFDPVHFMMERRMMLGIKERAEKRSGVSTRCRAASTWSRDGLSIDGSASISSLS
jgi:uncharacterized protein YndB with AHSA1/START domain